MGLPHFCLILTLPPYLFTLLGLLPRIHASDDFLSQNLAGMPEFASQAPCAASCFYIQKGACSLDLVGVTLGCAGGCFSGAANQCYCATNYQSLATSYLYSCVSKACTQGNVEFDISTATSLYGAYCLSAGYTPPTPTATGEGLAGGSTVYVTATTARFVEGDKSQSTSLPASPGSGTRGTTSFTTTTKGSPEVTGEGPRNSSPESTLSSNGLSKDGIAAVIVGVFFGVLTAGIAIWAAKRKDALRE